VRGGPRSAILWAGKLERGLNSTDVTVTVITGLVKSEKEEEASLGWTFHWKARGGSFTRIGHEKVNRALKGRGKETLSS
jgi:hypothetical protein